MANLKDNIDSIIEFKNLFFGKRVEASKKKCWQSICPGNCIIERGVDLYKNYASSNQTIGAIYSNL